MSTTYLPALPYSTHFVLRATAGRTLSMPATSSIFVTSDCDRYANDAGPRSTLWLDSSGSYFAGPESVEDSTALVIVSDPVSPMEATWVSM